MDSFTRKCYTAAAFEHISLFYFTHRLTTPHFSSLSTTPTQRHVHVLLCLHAHQSSGDGQVASNLVEIKLDVVAVGPVCDHDGARHLLVGNQLPHYVVAGCNGLCRVHFVPLYLVCPVFCAKLREAKIEQKEAILSNNGVKDEE
jgi:hypothetical protein